MWFATNIFCCLVPRRLSLDENVRAKEGGKETSAPFPWFFAAHHQSLASTINRLEKRSAWGGGCIFCVLQILHLGAFKQPSLIGSGRFLLSDSGFSLTFGQIVSISVKQLDNTNLVVSRHIKRERASLPVLMCVAQKRVSLGSVIRKRQNFRFFAVVTTIMVRTNVQSLVDQIMAFFHDKRAFCTNTINSFLGTNLVIIQVIMYQHFQWW